MFFNKGQNGSITERESKDDKIIKISSKKLNNNITLYKRKFYISKNKEKYKNRTISINDDENFKFNIRRNSQIRNKLYSQNLKIDFKGIINKNENIKEKRKTKLDTSRWDKNTKEKYLSKFFIDKVLGINKNKNIGKNEIKYRNKYSRNDINKLGYNKNFNKSYMIRNESLINLEKELNYEFEELQKTNNKLKVKIFNIKTEQNRYKQKSKNEKIISKIIEIYIQYIKKDENLQRNEDIVSEPYPAIKSFKNMLLNIMDWKFSYENILMIEQFFLAINSCMNNNNKGLNFINNIKDIKLLLEKRITFKKIINDIKFHNENNQNYQKYFSKLCNFFNFQNLEQLEQFLKNGFNKYYEELKEVNRPNNSILKNSRNKRKNSSLNNSKILNNEYYQEKKSFIRKNNSEINININSRNIEKIFNYSKEPLIENNLFYTYRNYKPNNKKENEYIKEITNRSEFTNQNPYINFNKKSKKKNFNSKNSDKEKINIPNYIKSVTHHYLRNEN